MDTNHAIPSLRATYCMDQGPRGLYCSRPIDHDGTLHEARKNHDPNNPILQVWISVPEPTNLIPAWVQDLVAAVQAGTESKRDEIAAALEGYEGPGPLTFPTIIQEPLYSSDVPGVVPGETPLETYDRLDMGQHVNKTVAAIVQHYRELIAAYEAGVL